MSTQARRGRKVQDKAKQKNLRLFYIGIGSVVIIGIIVLAIVLTRNSGSTASDPQISVVNAPIGMTTEGFYYKGNPDAAVTVIEYSDFQCPACASFQEILGDKINTDYIESGKIQFVYHEFPLRNSHPHAIIAAEAARAAGEQGQFWPMHDLLFQNQNEWARSNNPESLFIRYAEQLGLDRDQFANALDSGKFRAQVEAAEQGAFAANIQATPTFVVNGQPVNANQLVATIDAALANQGQ